MKRITRVFFMACYTFLTIAAVRAEPSQEPASEKQSASKHNPVSEKPATTKMPKQKNDSDKQESKKNATSGQKTTQPVSQTIKKLNLELPKNLDEDAAAVSLGDLNQSLPDLFAPQTDSGRLSVNGNLLVEEDLELNPGAGVDKKDAKSRDGKKAETTILDDVEGAQLNFRLKID